MLLERLSKDREEILSVVIASGQKKVFCSCGSAFTEITEAENHFVQHEKLNCDKENSPLDDGDLSIFQDESYMFETLKQIVQKANNRKQKAKDSLTDISQKFKSRFEFAVIFGETEIDVGSLADLECPLCEESKPVSLSSFEQLKKHFLLNHPQCWMPRPHGQILSSKVQLAETPRKSESTKYWLLKHLLTLNFFFRKSYFQVLLPHSWLQVSYFQQGQRGRWRLRERTAQNIFQKFESAEATLRQGSLQERIRLQQLPQIFLFEFTTDLASETRVRHQIPVLELRRLILEFGESANALQTERSSIGQSCEA